MSKSIIFIALALYVVLPVAAQTSTNILKRKQHFNLENTIAIQGYDPVAYFKSGKAVKGKKEFAVNAEGIIYYCSTAANKALLIQNYTAYEPQYGGWCAYAMGSSGEKVDITPETFNIVDGKLYLFYNAYFNNTLNSWNKAETTLKKSADLHWNKIINP
jgi:hypothetical protein